MSRIPFHPPVATRLGRLLAPLVATRPGGWFFVHVANPIDRVLMPATKGRFRMSLDMPSVVLNHRGAKTGLERTTALIYFSDGDDIVLVGSNGGSPQHPAWYHNVARNPDVTLSNGRFSGHYRGREADGDDRERLWRSACELYPGYATYQQRAGSRRLPVMVFSSLE